MKLPYIFSLLIFSYGCHTHQIKYRSQNDIFTGNNKIEFKETSHNIFTDGIDDTINYKQVADGIFKDTSGKIFKLSIIGRPGEKDSFNFVEYYKDFSAFIDIKTYKQIGGNYFSNKNKVYLWWGNSDGDYPQEIKGADSKTFVPFENVAGGHDKFYAYYGGPPSDFEIIEGADPKTIKTLDPEEGCWNCLDCYFVDDKNVFSGFAKIKNADRKTFKLINTSDSIDAEDKNFTYYRGEVVNRKINKL